MKNTITLSTEADVKDKESREWVEKLMTKIETLNERTKKHTREIKELQKKIAKERE